MPGAPADSRSTTPTTHTSIGEHEAQLAPMAVAVAVDNDVAHVMTTQMSSRQFNQDTSGAKKAAENGPVYITDRGRPAHVLLTFDDCE